jgi:hypothetical protein
VCKSLGSFEVFLILYGFMVERLVLGKRCQIVKACDGSIFEFAKHPLAVL